MEHDDPQVHDIAIVGGGPTGLYAAYYAGFRGLSTVTVDSLPALGGQITAMYPDKPIYDVAGFPSVVGRELVAGLIEQSAPFKGDHVLGESVQDLKPLDGSLFELTTDHSTVIRAKAVVITGGIGTFKPRPLPAGGAWIGRGLSYFVTSLEAHAGQDVVVVGGGDSACDWALSLAPIARSVTLVHRRDEFRAHSHTLTLLNESDVRVLVNSQLVELRGDKRIAEVVIRRADGWEIVVPADEVVSALGFLANLGPIREWGIEIASNRFVTVDSSMSTNLPGVYSAGDIADYPGKVRLISVGFGEAATAVNNAATFIDPKAGLFPGHSSEMSEPAGIVV